MIFSWSLLYFHFKGIGVDELKDKHLCATHKSGKNAESLKLEIEDYKKRIDEIGKILEHKNSSPSEVEFNTRRIRDELTNKKQAEDALKEIQDIKPDHRLVKGQFSTILDNAVFDRKHSFARGPRNSFSPIQPMYFLKFSSMMLCFLSK